MYTSRARRQTCKLSKSASRLGKPCTERQLRRSFNVWNFSSNLRSPSKLDFTFFRLFEGCKFLKFPGSERFFIDYRAGGMDSEKKKDRYEPFEGCKFLSMEYRRDILNILAPDFEKLEIRKRLKKFEFFEKGILHYYNFEKKISNIIAISNVRKGESICFYTFFHPFG